MATENSLLDGTPRRNNGGGLGYVPSTIVGCIYENIRRNRRQPHVVEAK